MAPSSRPASRTDRPAPERRPEPSRPGSRRVGRKVWDLDRRDACDRRARRRGAPRVPRHPVVRRSLERPGGDLPRCARGGRRARAALGRGRDLDPGGAGRGHRVLPKVSPTASRRTTGPARRPSWRASARTSPDSSSPTRESRRGAEGPHVARALGRVHHPGADPVGRGVRDRRVRQARSGAGDLRRCTSRSSRRATPARWSSPACSLRVPTPRCSPPRPCWSGSASR